MKLEREFGREYHLITREERLETIAKDIVSHFMGKGYRGKAMVISIDKATAVKMYDKVQKHWKQYIVDLAKAQTDNALQNISHINDAMERILINDETKRGYLQLAANVAKLYKAILPDPDAHAFKGAV